MMTSRLARRRHLVIAGCIFAVVVSGIACTGVVRASGCEISVSAGGDGPAISSAEWAWEASDGDLLGIPPAGAGQEVIRGGYSGSVVSSGPVDISFSRSLESEDTPLFSTAQEMRAAGHGTYQESVSINSCGAPGGDGSCQAPDNTTGLDRSAYCEHAGASVVLMTDSLHYSSVGTISQGNIENQDSLVFRSSADGSGSGYFMAAAGSMNGIGTSRSPGYIQNVREEILVSGRIHLEDSINWTSANIFGNPE
jgi:hypothetical protein